MRVCWLYHMLAGEAFLSLFLCAEYCRKYLTARSLMARYGYLGYCVIKTTCQGCPASGWLSLPFLSDVALQVAE